VHPVLFTLPGGVEIHSYGFLACVGYLISVFSIAKLAERDGIARGRIYDLAIVCMVGVVVGCRLEYVRTHWQAFEGKGLGAMLNVRDGGSVFYGGFIGATLLGLIYMQLSGMPKGRVIDLIAPFICLATALGRLGCFASGCCYGKPSSLPWAISFPEGSLAPAGVPLHPTQLYEVVYSLVLGGLLVAWMSRRKVYGELLPLWGVGYGTSRYINEFLRDDAERGWAVEGVLTNAQATGLVLIVLSVVAFRAVRRGGERV
jgi:phosphatidylglycerol:prolipoprotein diacylglycerol transferase